MFSPQIVESEDFLSMPVSSQNLYFHLGMNADDDGFIQPQITMRIVGATADDLKVLLAKRFLLSFDSGVVVVKHWLIHNLIQKDRYHPTRFQEEKSTLLIKENKAYTDNPDSVNKMLTEVRLGKVRLDKPTAQSAEETEIVSVDDNGDPYTPRWRKKPPDKNSDIILGKLEMKYKFTSSARMRDKGCISRALKLGFTADQIDAKFQELLEDEFWASKGVNVCLVCSKLGEVKAEKKAPTVMIYKSKK